ncbi:hypothetical protein DQX05_08135 [Paenibacillus thiaminolyticus]|uniref:Uncharacterized protein n=1 Tax=Paenibacillus thiaminolyticus TaxID=49283 RepID=A0A3A3GJX9_PANTH|nr:hypothetical protein DQX05_08135 [Paenibacillus thiaminolyticus]
MQEKCAASRGSHREIVREGFRIYRLLSLGENACKEVSTYLTLVVELVASKDLHRYAYAFLNDGESGYKTLHPHEIPGQKRIT